MIVVIVPAIIGILVYLSACMILNVSEVRAVLAAAMERAASL